jgi:energy-coupling factor transporter ATP-binding protein EcfA2
MEMSAAIEIQGLSYTYPNGRPALRDVSFSIEEGECIAVLGPNGAGKSTLLLHLNGLLPEKLSGNGAIHICGEPITNETLGRVRQKVGFLFQDPDDQLISATVFEDVAFGPRQLGVKAEELPGLVARCLAVAGIAGFEDREPHRLSHGEKRRVCLAGVLACEPSVLVLDEPTSDLDPRGRRELKKLLSGLRVARVIATHDLELAVDLCSRVIVLDGGRIVAEGPTAKVLADEELMYKHGLEKPHSLLHRHPHF